MLVGAYIHGKKQRWPEVIYRCDDENSEGKHQYQKDIQDKLQSDTYMYASHDAIVLTAGA